MWFCTLLDTLLTRSSRTRSRKMRPAPSFRRRARSFRPLLEILEDRTLLSTYVVDSLTDTGAGSGLTGDLRYCITNATSGNDTITFAQGLTGTIQLQSALPTLNASVAIQGPGANLLTVEYAPNDGNLGFDLFDITLPSVSVEISGLTLYGDMGGSDEEEAFTELGAIANAGTLTASDCIFSDNYNPIGASAITNSGTTTFSNCTFNGNYSPSYAGAILNDGTVTVSNCIFNDNFSSPGGLAPNAGAILNDGTATVSNSTFNGNYSNKEGGAITNSNNGALTLNYCTLSGNFLNYSSPDARGGAIANQGALTINNSTLSDNFVRGNRNVYTFSGGYTGIVNGLGGGIYMSAGALSINSSTIADNEAIGGSATAAALNAGSGYGGGLYIAGGTVSINNSTLADNQAISGAATPPAAAGNGYGGGIYNAAGPGALQMYDTILAGDTADTADPDLDGSVTSLGHNLIGNSTGGSGFAASDLLNVNPQLGPLQNNGGPTQTMALLPGSPAINAGDNTNAPAYDQRGPGFPRIVGGTIDIGAFEVQNGTNQGSFAVSGFPASITAGNAGSFTVTALNADGSTDTSYTGTVHFTSSDPQAILPANYTFTTADAGVHTFSAILKTAGTQSITATDTTTGSSGSDTGITVTPAAASELVFGQQPSTTTAGQTISPAVTVDVEDQYGNLVTSDSSIVTLTLSSGTFADGSTTASAAASGGVATFNTLTIDRAGSYTLKASDGSLTPTTSGSFTVQAAAASSLSVTGFPTSTTAGVAHNLTVTLYDPYGNIATGYSGTVHFTSSDRQAALPANYTFTTADAGVHAFSATLKTAGTQSITSTDTTTASLTGTEGSIEVNPAAASKFLVTAPASVRPGVPFSLTVTVEDAYGNVVTGYTGTIHFSSTDTRATLPANYTFSATDAGVHTFTGLVLRKRGYQKISVTDAHNSAVTGNTNVDVL